MASTYCGMFSGLAMALGLFSGSWACQALKAGTNSGRKRRSYSEASGWLPLVDTSSQRLKFRRSWVRNWAPVVAARLDSERAVFACAYSRAWSPFHRAAWYPLHAMPSVASDRRIVAMSSSTRSLLVVDSSCASVSSCGAWT